MKNEYFCIFAIFFLDISAVAKVLNDNYKTNRMTNE